MPVERDCPVFVIIARADRERCRPAGHVQERDGDSSDWIRCSTASHSPAGARQSMPDTWRVEHGQLVAKGHAATCSTPGRWGTLTSGTSNWRRKSRPVTTANSGNLLPHRISGDGLASKGYEVQINNTYAGDGRLPGTEEDRAACTACATSTSPCVADGQWFRLRVRVVANRIRVWVNDFPTVDYLQPEDPPRSAEHAGQTAVARHHCAAGTRSGQCSGVPLSQDPSAAAGRRPGPADRASDAGYGVDAATMDRFACGVAFRSIDFHIHLRGGLTPAKALDRQAVTGIARGVLDNIGKGWTIETDEQLRRFSTVSRACRCTLGMQVNDRDWMHRHSPELIAAVWTTCWPTR